MENVKLFSRFISAFSVLVFVLAVIVVTVSAIRRNAVPCEPTHRNVLALYDEDGAFRCYTGDTPIYYRGIWLRGVLVLHENEVNR